MERLHALEMEKRQAGNRMNQHMYLGAPRISKHHNWKPVLLGFRVSEEALQCLWRAWVMKPCCHVVMLGNWNIGCHAGGTGRGGTRKSSERLSKGLVVAYGQAVSRAVNPKKNNSKFNVLLLGLLNWCDWRSSKQSFKKLKVPGFKKWHPFGERSLKRPNGGYDTQGIWRILMGKSRLLGRQILFCQVILLIRWSAKHVPSTWKCNTSVKLREIWKKLLDGKVWCSNQPLGGLGNNACSIGMQMSRPAWQLVKRPRLRLG